VGNTLQKDRIQFIQYALHSGNLPHSLKTICVLVSLRTHRIFCKINHEQILQYLHTTPDLKLITQYRLDHQITILKWNQKQENNHSVFDKSLVQRDLLLRGMHSYVLATICMFYYLEHFKTHT